MGGRPRIEIVSATHNAQSQERERELGGHERTYGMEEIELKEVGEARGSQPKIDDAPEGLADKWVMMMMMRIKGGHRELGRG